MIPGEYILRKEPIICNKDRESTTIVVVNRGDRPIQAGSHFHFYEVNKALEFDRQQAYGKRLDIPAGTAVRFEPGNEKQVPLIDLVGKREIYGLNNQIDGPLIREDK